jgi:hypothetical protein
MASTRKRWIVTGLLLAGLAVTSCSAPSTTSDPGAKESGATTKDSGSKSKYTKSQEEARESAQSYLDMGGFSRKGLIQQLSSDAGEGFSKKDATVAVDSLHVDWKAEAVESAQSYLDTGGFSHNSLVQQLSSPAGEGFTKAQAEYAVKKVGL